MSGNGDSGLAASAFVGEDGSIKWPALATTLVGGVLTVTGVGIAGVWSAVFQGAISIVNGIASFSGGVFEKFGGVVAGVITTSWNLATTAVAGLNSVWAPVVGLAVVFGYLYIWRWSDG